MMWAFGIIVVLVLGGVAVVAAGRGEPMSEAYDDRPDALVPTGRPLAADDLRKVRFSVALRGYRMSEVDALLARLAAELEQRDHGSEVVEPPPAEEHGASCP
jgi:DivIVA domain-containing protein